MAVYVAPSGIVGEKIEVHMMCASVNLAVFVGRGREAMGLMARG